MGKEKYEEYWKKKEEERAEATRSGSSSRDEYEARWAENYMASLPKRLESLTSKRDSLYKNYTSRFTDKDGNYINAYRGDTKEALANFNSSKASIDKESKAILDDLAKYEKYLDADKVKEIQNYLSGYSNDLDGMYETYKTDHNYFSQFEDEDAYNRYNDDITYSEKYAKSTYADLQKAKKDINNLLSEDKDNDILNRELYWLQNHDTGRQYVDTMSKEELEALKKAREPQKDEANAKYNFAKHNLDTINQNNIVGRAIAEVMDYFSDDYENPYNKAQSELGKAKAEKDNVEGKVLYFDDDGVAVTVDDVLRDREHEETFKGIEGNSAHKSAYDKALEAQANIEVLGEKSRDLQKQMATYQRAGVVPDALTLELNSVANAIAKNNKVIEDFNALGYDFDELSHYKRMKESREALADNKVEATQYAQEHPIKATLKSIATAPATIGEFAGNLVDSAQYGYSNIYDDKYINQNQTYQSTVADTIDSKVMEKTDNEVLAWLASGAYSGVTSSAQSALTTGACMLMFGPAGGTVALGIMGTEAAASSYNNAIMNGSTNGEAILTAVSSGIAEAAFEKISLDRLINIGNMYDVSSMSALIKSMIKNSGATFVQGGVEASEEFFTEIANKLADEVINGDHSAFNTAVAKYKDMGYSDADAKQIASKYALLEIVEALYGGFIGGVGSGAGASLTQGTRATATVIDNAIKTNKYYNQQGQNIIDQGNLSQLEEEAKALGGKDVLKALKNLADEAAGVEAKELDDKSKKKYAHQVGKLYKEVQKTQLKNLSESSKTAFKNVIKAELEKTGVGNVDATADILVKAAHNESLTRAESRLLQSVNGHEILNKAYSSKEFVKTLSTEEKKQFEESRDNILDTVDLTHDKGKAKILAESDYDVSSDGTTTIETTGEEVNLMSVDSLEGDDISFKVKNGDSEQVVLAGELRLNEDYVVILEGLKDIKENFGLDVSSANSVLALWDGYSGNAVDFSKAMKSGIMYGQYNMRKDFENSRMGRNVPDNIREELFRIGREYKQRVTDERESDVRANGNANAENGEFSITYAEGVTYESLNDSQKAQVDFAQVIAKTFGFNLEIFRSPKNALGQSVGENGSYNLGTNTMRLDVDAGTLDGKSLVLFTQSHELTHFIKKWSPKAFKTFADLLVEKYGSNGVSVDKLVNDKITQSIMQTKTDKTGKHHVLSYEEAFEEVVCDACEDFLADPNIQQTIAEFAKVDKNLAQKIKDFLKGLITKLEEAIKGLQGQSKEAKALRELDIEDLEDLKNHWAAALFDARENVLQAKESDAKAEKNTTDEGDVKEQARFKGHSNIEKNGNKRYNKKTFYNEYATNMMQWANSASTEVGDLKILSNKGKWVLLEATENGCIELRSGTYKEVKELYDKANRQSNNEFYEYSNKIRSDGSGSVRNRFGSQNRTNVDRDAGQDRSQELQTDFERDNEHLRSGDKRESVKRQDRDSLGRTLTKVQQSYFAESKIRDKNGNLMVMYHGSPKDDISSFRLSLGGAYFTANSDYAREYARDVGKVYEVYLNITKPFDTRNAECRAIFEKEFYGQWGNGAPLGDKGLPDWTDGDDLIDFLQEKGYDYDGLLLDEGGVPVGNGVKDRGISYVVFDRANQVKYTDNLNPTENEDMKFSLRENVEETKDLVAVHGMAMQNLMDSLALGGLPMPSIAIIKARMGHNKYGDVSLVFGKETIDPELNNANKVYGLDVWSPVYPTIEFKVNEAVSSKIRDKYYKLGKEYGYDNVKPLYAYAEELERQLNIAEGEQGLLEKLYNDVGLMNVYLLDSGKPKVEPVTVEERTVLSDMDVESFEFLIGEIGRDVIDEFILPEGVRGPWAQEHKKAFWDKHLNEVQKAYGNMFIKLDNFTEEEANKIVDNTSRFELNNWLNKIVSYIKNGKVKIKVTEDRAATEEAIKKAAQDGYVEWVDDLFKGVAEKSGIRNNVDYFDKYGNRRDWEALHYANKLENVVKVMKGQENGTSFFNAGALWAIAAKDYGTIQEIKADSDRLKLLSEDEYSTLKKAIGARVDEIADSLNSKYSDSNYFIDHDNKINNLFDAIKSSKTKSGVLKYLNQYFTNATEATVTDLLDVIADAGNLPTEYFEAKPQRAVMFDEVKAVIIPDNAPQELREQLDSMGLNVLTYEHGNDNSRTEVLNSIEDVKFQDRVTPEQDAEYLELAKNPEKNEARLREMVDEAANEMLSKSKLRTNDGKLRKVYHGTNTGDFTVFNPDYIGMSSGDDGFFGKGFYFAFTKGEASYYGANRIITAYLDLRNPFNYIGELLRYNGERASYGRAPDAVFAINIYDKFPDIVKDKTITAVLDWGSYDEDAKTVELSYAEFSKIFKDIVENKKFSYTKHNGEYGVETIVTSDEEIVEYEYEGKKHTYSNFGFQKTFLDDNPSVLDVAYEYLVNKVYKDIDLPNRTSFILDNNDAYTETLKERGYDGVVQSMDGDEAVVFESSQVKSADLVTYDEDGNIIPLSERFNEGNDDIRYQDRVYNGSLTQERIDDLIHDSGAGNRVDYAREWIASINPSDFLDLTLEYEIRIEGRDYFDAEVEGDHGSVMGDRDYIADLQGSNTIPVLYVNMDTGKVAMHNGRHRMRALEKLGATRTPIRIVFYNDDEMYKGNNKGERLETIEDMRLTSQFDDKFYRQHKAIIRDIIPLNEDHRAEIEKAYRAKPFEVKYGWSIAYQDRQYQPTLEDLGIDYKEENEKLKADVDRLKEMLKLQGTVTHGKALAKASYEGVAKKLLHEFGMKRVTDTEMLKEFINKLDAFYSYIINEDDLIWEDMFDKSMEIARWMDGKLPEQVVYKNPNAVEILRDIREKGIMLSDKQKEEATYYAGSLSAYRKMNFGNFKIVNEGGISLTDLWEQLVTDYPGAISKEYIEKGEVAENLPSLIVEVVEIMRQTEKVINDDNRLSHLREIATVIYDSYWQIPTVRTLADKHQQKVNLLKGQHKAEMDALKEKNDSKLKDTKEYYQDMVKRIRADKDAKMDAYKERVQEQKKKNVEGRHKTATKNKIKRVVKELDKLLNKGNKKSNVKDGMQDMVKQALALSDLLLGDVISAETILSADIPDERLSEDESAMLKKWRDAVKSRAKFQTAIDNLEEKYGSNKPIEAYEELVKSIEIANKSIKTAEKNLSGLLERERKRLNSNSVKVAIESLSKAYETLKDSNVDYISSAYDKNISDKLKNLVESLEGVNVKDMSLSDLQEVYMAYKMVLTTVRNANKLFVNGRKEDFDEINGLILQEISSHKKKKESKFEPADKVLEGARNFTHNNLKPLYFFEELGSNALKRIFYDEIARAQRVYAIDYREAREYIENARKKHNYYSWNKDSQTIKLLDGRTVKFSMQELMSIYAYSKRPQADKHMSEGGFAFDNKAFFKDVEEDVDGKKVKIRELRSDAETPYRITEFELAKIKKLLGKERCEYVDDMQKYLSEDMANKGNSVTRIMYGIDIFNEKVYFPLKSSEDYKIPVSTTNAEFSLKGSGFTKETEPSARNPIVLEGFEDVWAKHVNEMSTYHSLVLPIENMNKVLGYTEYINTPNSLSTKQIIRKVYGSSALNYIENYIQDMNGGFSSNKGAQNFFAKGFSNFKKTAVGASMSTVIQQPTAILRAMSMINPKYFVKYETANHKVLQDEMFKYAPISVIKQIGGFDAGGNGSAVSSLLSKEYKGIDKAKAFFEDKEYRKESFDDAMMLGATFADEIGWNIIWNAVKNEVKDTTTFTPGTDEFLNECGNRFDEVINATQVYDSVLSRSGYMRSNNELVKMSTAFMGEPSTSFNMLFNAVTQAKRGNISKTKAVGIVTSVYASVIAAAALKSLIYALRDDDDEESYVEKYMSALSNSLKEELWIHNMLPFLSDIATMFDGWEVERTDIAVFKDVVDAFNDLDSSSKSDWRKAEDLFGAFAGLFGIPLKNVMRTGREMWNMFANILDDNTADEGDVSNAIVESLFGETTMADANEALEKGKTDKAKEIISDLVADKVEEGKTEKEAKTSIKSSVTSYWKPLYLQAYRDNDNAEMLRIRRILQSTGLYDNVVETCSNWIKGMKDETTDTTYTKW